LIMLSLFAQCKMHHWWLVLDLTCIEKTADSKPAIRSMFLSFKGQKNHSLSRFQMVKNCIYTTRASEVNAAACYVRITRVLKKSQKFFIKVLGFLWFANLKCLANLIFYSRLENRSIRSQTITVSKAFDWSIRNQLQCFNLIESHLPA
jgi:hypothetical protein